MTDTALVIEGGAMRGTHTAGAVVALIEAGIRVSWVSSISAGSTNASNYLTQDAWRAKACFTTFAQDPKFGGWRSFARGNGFFNSKYIYTESGLPGAAVPFNWQRWSESTDQWRIGAFDATDGRTVYWGREDMPTMHDVFVRVQASSSMPVLMPAVRIDGHQYLDGAIGSSGGVPLDAAQADGFERFLVLLTQPRGFVKAPQGHERALRTYFRKYPAVAEAMRTRADRYNATRDELLELEKSGHAYLFTPEHALVSNGERRLDVLERTFQDGYEQAVRELPAIREFLGIDNSATS
ncbi:patatin-like phospholipase family protein [Rudaeicoccus suwonensis]|uniref:patatin-like phospholipase family protein n=1 Tax=Rudaeicoccus suwonensis TaxID=657409 RepID=UPI001FE69CA0|nr:patatin family protein [Rudaeicoccus suwonensis]